MAHRTHGRSTPVTLPPATQSHPRENHGYESPFLPGGFQTPFVESPPQPGLLPNPFLPSQQHLSRG